MIRQYDAQQMCDKKLKELGLYSKGWRTCFSKDTSIIGRCWHDMKRIELSVPHLNSRSEADLMETILHEAAHAICGPNTGHGSDWINKAKELGLSDPKPCGNFISLDNGRALSESERIPKTKRSFHRLDAVCPICSKKAEESSSITLSNVKWTKLKCGHLVKHEQIKSNSFDFSTWESESGKQLFPYQIDGIKFIEVSGGRALVADEPGLGKTVQALGFLKAHKEEVCPALWVCKTTLKLQATKEAVDWCGPEFMAQIIENPRNFIIPGLKIYIISMDLLRNMPTEKFEQMGFKTIIADEIQHFKNPDSTRTAELRKLVSKAEYFIPLSGTPWKNRGQEYFPVLNMLDSTRFPSYENFKNTWVDTYQETSPPYKIRQGGIRNIPRFREFTKDIVIRRLRDDVLPDLPKINRQIRFIDMEDVYKVAYDKAEEHFANVIKASLIDGVDPKNLQGELMRLKHITGLAKVKVTIEDVLEFLENSPSDTDKICVFHHHIDVGDNLQRGDGHSYEGIDEWLKRNHFNPTLRLFGGRKPEERNDIIERFKNDKRNRVLIASTLASGEGLNIQFCQNAVMMERQWNPQNEEQAELRFSRPLTWGDYPPYLQQMLFNENKEPKKVSIRVPYMVADGTVDDILTKLVERKRHNFVKSMNVGMENIQWNENDIMREVSEYILKKRLKKDVRLV